MRLTVLVLVLLLLLPVLVLAVKPTTQTDESPTTFAIDYPKYDLYHQGLETTLHFHIFDADGLLKNGSDVACGFHLYNETGDHIMIANLENDSNQVDLYVTINSSIMANTGRHSYIVGCTNGSNGGFVSSAFTVTRDAFHQDQVPGGVWWVVIVPLFLCFIFLFGSATMDEEHNAFRIGLFLLSSIPFFSSLYFATVILVEYYGFTALQEAIGNTVWWYGAIWVVVITYFIIYLIYKMFIYINDKNERLKY